MAGATIAPLSPGEQLAWTLDRYVDAALMGYQARLAQGLVDWARSVGLDVSERADALEAQKGWAGWFLAAEAHEIDGRLWNGVWATSLPVWFYSGSVSAEEARDLASPWPKGDLLPNLSFRAVKADLEPVVRARDAEGLVGYGCGDLYDPAFPSAFHTFHPDAPAKIRTTLRRRARKMLKARLAVGGVA